MKLRVIFFGSAGNVFSERFYASLKRTPCTIVAVVNVPARKRSSTNPTGNAAFIRAGGPVFEPRDPNTSAFVAKLRALKPDLFLAVGYLFKLKADLLAVPRIASANVHASLLPAYRGRSPVFWALRQGERYSGLTIHAMDAGLDTGDILYQAKVPTRDDDTVASLYDRVIDKGVTLVPRLVADATRGRLPRRRQLKRGSSYFSAPTEDDYRIDWSRKPAEIRRQITITPGKCFADIDGQRVYFRDALVN